MLKIEIKNPIVNSIIYFILAYIVIVQLLSGILLIAGSLLFGISYSSPDGLIISFISAIISLLIYILVYRKKIKDIITTKRLKFGLMLGLPFLLMFIPYIFNIPEITTYDLTAYVILFAISGALGAGIMEEVLFRGILINSFMEKIKKENYIPIAVFLSALLFCLVHVANLLMGADLNQTILQVFYAFCLGAFFAALYLRTGNIIVTIFYHSLMDFIGLLLNPNAIQTGGALTSSISLLAPESITIIIISIVLLILSFYYVRSEKRGEIMELWNLKKI